MTDFSSRTALIKQEHGEDFYQKIGRKGGVSKVLKGMAKLKVEDPERFAEVYKNRRKRS